MPVPKCTLVIALSLSGPGRKNCLGVAKIEEKKQLTAMIQNVPLEMIRSHQLGLQGRAVGAFPGSLRCDVAGRGDFHRLCSQLLRLPAVGQRTITTPS